MSDTTTQSWVGGGQDHVDLDDKCRIRGP